MAVTGTITITTLLFFYVDARVTGGHRCGWCCIGASLLLAVDLLFLAANLTKLVHGAWLPLLIGITVFTDHDDLAAWTRAGHPASASRTRGRCRSSSTELHDRTPALLRVPGTAVFLNRGKRDRAAGHAGQRGAQPCPARARRDHVDRDRAGAAGSGRASGSLIDDLGYADDGITHVTRPVRLHGDTGRARRSPAGRGGGAGTSTGARRGPYFLSTIELRRERCADDGPMAQAAVHRHLRPSRPTPPSTSACPVTER